MGKTCRYAGLYKSRSSVPEACKSLIGSQYAVVRKNYRGALRSSDSVYLHDMRVALRRIRTIIKFFGKSRDIKREDRLDMMLKRICAKLGKMRDLQSRVDLLKTLRSGSNTDATAYENKCIIQLQRGKPRLRRALQSSEWNGCMASLRAIQKTGGKGEESASKAGEFCAARIARAFRKFEAEDFVRPEYRDALDLHALRRRLRKLRYKVEICAPVLGTEMKDLERLCKKVTETLGRIHDIDMVIDISLSKSGPAVPKKLMLGLKAERKKMMKKLKGLLQELKLAVKGREMKRYLKARCS